MRKVDITVVSQWCHRKVYGGRGGAYEIGEPDDSGAVEIEPRELGPGDTNIERQPISKVRESILRLEIEALKQNK